MRSCSCVLLTKLGRMNTTLRSSLFLLALLLDGCVLPNRLAEEDPFREGVIGFLEPGITTKTDVRAELGGRYLDYSNGQWWVFHANRRMTEWFWIFCMPGGCGGAEFGGHVRNYDLVVEFGNDDIVRRSVVVTDQSPCNEDQSICFDRRELTVVVSGVSMSYTLGPDMSIAPDAVLASEVTSRDGKTYEIGASEPLTGQVALLDRLGFPEWVRTYENGELSGIETFWYSTGQISYQAHYSSNLRHGPATSWNSDGSILSQTCYRNGVIVDMPANECHP